MDDNQIIVARLQGAYQCLVDETANPITATNRIKRRLLSKLLELCKYLLEGNDNPLHLWFSD